MAEETKAVEGVKQPTPKEILEASQKLITGVREGRLRPEEALVLLEMGADVDARDNDSTTSLYYAAQRRDVEMVNLLLRAHADPAAGGYRHRMPLQVAQIHRYREIVQIMEKKIVINANLMSAAIKNDESGVKDAMAAGADPCVKHSSGTPLDAAIRHGHSDIAKLLLQDTRVVNQMKNAPATLALFYDVSLEQPDIVKILLDKGINFRAKFDDGTVLDALIERYQALKADEKKQKDSLSLSIEYLLQAGAVPKDPQQLVLLLHDAIKNGRVDLVSLLLDGKIDVNNARDKGYTPLHIAAGTRQAGIVRLLLERQADPNAQAPLEYTPLHEAAATGGYAVIKLLLAHKADVDARDYLGNTPLHMVAQNGQHKRAELLVEAGVDRGAVNNADKTAFDLRRRNSNPISAIYMPEDQRGKALYLERADSADRLRPIRADKERERKFGNELRRPSCAFFENAPNPDVNEQKQSKENLAVTYVSKKR